MKNILRIFIVIFSGMIIFSSCNKYDEDIVGVWTKVWFTENDKNTTVVWNITSSGEIIQTTTIGGSSSVITGSYEIVKSSGSHYINLTNIFSTDADNGKYRIFVLTDDVLAIQKRETSDEYGFVYNRLEFIRN